MENFVLSCLESRVEKNTSLYARFLLAPFINGHALTVATALRRALLSEVEGFAIIALDIQGVTHEFSTIVGVRESVLELSLNFQQIILRQKDECKSKNDLQNQKVKSPASQIGYLQIQGPRVVYANDLKLPMGIECVDPTQHIATISTDGILILKFLIGKGRQSQYLKKNNTLLTVHQVKRGKKVLKGQVFKSDICLQNIIPLDFFLTPVNRVNFVVESDHLSNKMRERILLELWTNGSIHPRQAIHEATLSLVDMFSAFRQLNHLDSHFLLFKSLQNTHLKNQKFHSTTELSPSLNTPASSSTLDLVKPAFSENSEFDSNFFKKQKNEKNFYFTANEKKKVSKRFLSLYKSNLDQMSFLASDIGNISLSLKTYCFLKQKGVHTLQNLTKYSSPALLTLLNGNKNMFFDIKRYITKVGLQLKD